MRQLFNPFRAEPENGIPGVWVQLALSSAPQFRCSINLGQEWRLRMADDLFTQLHSQQVDFALEY